MSIRRYIQIVEDAESASLDDLRNEENELMKRWFEIVKNDPEPKNDPDAANAWWADLERGGLWRHRIRPLRKKIADLEADIAKRARIARLKKLSDADGFDHDEVLYHGSRYEFDRFDISKVRTAAHLYTSPDRETAEAYGNHLYAVYGRQAPQADLTVETQDYGLLRKVFKKGGGQKGWGMSFDDLAELVFEGQLYQQALSSSLQDDVVSTCFDLGYRSVRITDPKPGGGFSDSVIFGDANDLQIVERLR